MKKQMILIFLVVCFHYFYTLQECDGFSLEDFEVLFRETQSTNGYEDTVPRVCKEDKAVVVIKNPSRPIYDKNIFVLEEELILGAKEGREEYMFTRIAGMDIDENRYIYILDKKCANVRVFNSNGEFLRTIGAPGQGPGEMQSPQFIQLTHNQQVIVWDPLTFRFLFFALDGKYIKQISSSRMSYPLHPFKFDSKGSLIALLIPPPPVGGIELAKFNSNLELMMRISKQEKDESYLKQEFKMITPSLLCAVSKNDCVVWGDSKEYILYIMNPQGRLTKKITRNSKPIKITKKDKEKLLEKFQRLSVKKLGFKPVFPKYYPSFHDLSIDWEGRIFVKTYEKFDDNDGLYFYDVFDSEGRYIAKVPIKEGLLGLFWGESELYTVNEDKEGFEMIKRFKVYWRY